MPSRTALALAVALVLLHTPPASAQQRVELWGAFSAVLDAPAGTLGSSFTPPLFSGTAISSYGNQILTINGNNGPGWQAGVNFFPSRHLGLQVLVDRGKADVSGVNGNYTVELTYVYQDPFSLAKRIFTTGGSVPWPDTTGTLKQLTVGFNAVARTDPARRVSASVSGGLSWYRITGDAQPLGYTEYHMGGHSTLFSSDMKLAIGLGPTDSAGYNIGGDVSIALGPHAAILLGYRYLGGKSVDVAVTPIAVVNAAETPLVPTPQEIAQRMQPAPVHLRVSSSRLVAGLKVIP